MSIVRPLFLAFMCGALVACGQVGPLTQREGAEPVVKPAGIIGLTAYP